MSNHVSRTTQIKVYELCKDGKSIFQEFVKEVQGDENLYDKFSGAISIIESSANLLRLSKGKFRIIHGHNLACKLYEVKKDIIRIYLFHEEKTGRVIVMGGKKGNQKEDLKSVIKIVKSYINGKK